MCKNVNQCVLCGLSLLQSCQNAYACTQPAHHDEAPAVPDRRLQDDSKALTEDEVAWTRDGSFILGKRLSTDDHAFLLRGRTPVHGRLGCVKGLAPLEGEEEEAEDIEVAVAEVPAPTTTVTTTRPGFRRTSSSMSTSSLTGRKFNRGHASHAVLQAISDNRPSMMWRQRNSENDLEIVAQTHSTRAGPMPIFPMHQQCYEGVFRPALAHLTGCDVDDVDRDMLFETLRTMKNRDSLYNFGIENHERWVCNCQSWPHCTESRPWYSNPSTVPEALTTYFANLPTLDVESPTFTLKKASRSAIPNIFSKLPSEITMQILENLDLPSVDAFRSTSQEIASKGLPASFWRARIQSDLPWVYDFGSSESSIRAIAAKSADNTDAPIDFRAVFAKLKNELSRSTKQITPDYHSSIPGLANRRRVWENCTKVAESYAALVASQ